MTNIRVWAAALVACGLVTACKDKKNAAGGSDAYDAWRDMREMVRQSPDHQPGKAARLVAAKDAAGLHAFVRDDIALLPPQADSFFDAESAVRWGARATLRGAGGTPRERAELLAMLYREAGFTAEVVVGALRPGADVAGLLARSPDRKLAYSFTAERQANWDAAIGERTGGDVQPLDPGGAVRAAMVAKLMPIIASAPLAPAFDTSVANVPLVRVVVNGSPTFANPNVVGAVFGDSYTVATPETAQPVSGERSLHVVLEMARSDRPAQRFTLLDHTMPARDVAGRSVTMAFATPEPFQEARHKHVGDAGTFIPTLLVRGDGLDDNASDDLSVVGAPFALGGEIITVQSNGTLVVDGDQVAAGPTPSALLSQVKSLSVVADGAAFPSVELTVAARRADDSGVPGLAADAFIIEEEGAAVAAQLRRSAAAPVRLLMLFDRSSSIPPEYLDNAATLGESIASAVFSAFPDAMIRVGGLSSVTPDYAGPFTSQMAEVQSQLAALTGLGSEVWGNLAAVAQDPSVNAVLFISDFQPEDAPTAELRSLIAAGPPVICAPVGSADTALAAVLAQLSDGLSLSGVTSAGLPGDVVDFLTARRSFDYRLVYRATESGPATRHVSVKLKAPSTATGAATYDVPATRVPQAGVSALYLTVSTGSRSVTRLLAGSDAGTAADRERVNAALFGKWVLAVEAHAPSLSVLIDEHLTERIASEPLHDALASNNATQLDAAARIGVFRVPADLRFMTTPLPSESDASDFTYGDGLRVAMHATVPVFGAHTLAHLDLMPLTPYETVRPAGGDTFGPTFTRTLTLAIAEHARFATNAWDLLKNETLVRFDPLTIDGSLGAAWAAPVAAFGDYQILAPADGAPIAFFAVHNRTGEVIGVLGDGSGGGITSRLVAQEESTAELVNRLQTILDVAKRAGEALGYEGVSAWADLESTKVGLLGSVIMLFEGEGGTNPNDVLNGLCGAGLNEVAGQIPGFDAATQPFDDLQSLYNALHELFGTETPEIPGLSGPAQAACDALFGG